MLFSQIIGQQEVKRKLLRSVAEQRVPHALLLRGPEGVGKLALALAYAQYINCENKSAADSCGTCPSCVKYNKMAHPDLHMVFPIIKGNKQSVVCDDFVSEFRTAVLRNPYLSDQEWYACIADDAKQGMIYANESQEIIRKLSLKTYESEYKVMLIWLPEKMNITCANKLLKILEEPPAKTLFLLVSNQPDEMITTILSRTQPVHVPRLTTEDLVQTLLHLPDSGISQHDALQIARMANGNYGAALAIVSEGDVHKQNFDRFVTVMRLAWQVGNKKDHASLKTLRKWADDMASSQVGRERQKDFLEHAQRMVRENFILNLQQNELNYLTAAEAQFSSRFSPFIHEGNVEDLMKEFGLAQRHIEQNVNARMVFFDLALKIIMLLKKQQ